MLRKEKMEERFMEKRDIIEFFDRCAPTWDAEMIKNDVTIGKILDNAEVGAGMDILDVACSGVSLPSPALTSRRRWRKSLLPSTRSRKRFR